MFTIKTQDEDTGEWREADESDGLNEPNSFSNRPAAEHAAREMVRRCAYHFRWKVVKE